MSNSDNRKQKHTENKNWKHINNFTGECLINV
jgi:hypothetical protein